MTIISQEKLAQLLCQIDRFFCLILSRLLSLLLLLLSIKSKATVIILIHWHLLRKLLPLIWLESLLLAERLLEILLLWGDIGLLHLPILRVQSSDCLLVLVIEVFILRIPLELVVLVLIKRFIGFSSISLALHLFLLLLGSRLLGGESS